MMCQRLSALVREKNGIDFDPKAQNVRCLNHIINLSVQDFLNDIKALSNNDNEREEETEASGSENDEDEVVGVTTTIGFARALFKIRTITKVPILLIPPKIGFCIPKPFSSLAFTQQAANF